MVHYWIDKLEELVDSLADNVPVYKVDNEEIPLLDDYTSIPEQNFWENFPSKQIPVKPCSRVNGKNLKKVIAKAGDLLTISEKKRGMRVVSDLEKGADACQKSELPAMSAKNNSTSFDNGPMITDKITTWIKKDIVSGPFETPPHGRFQSKSINCN